MELIAKTANAGKTTEAINIAASLEGYTIFVTTEDDAQMVSHRISELGPKGKVHVFNVQTAMSVKALIIGYSFQGINFENLVLDTNFGISHTEWFKLAQDAEENGMFVVTTQHLVKTRAQTKETLTVVGQ